MLVLAIAAAAAVAVVVVNGRSGSRHGLVVGGVEDAAKWGDPSENMGRARTAGFRVIVLSSVWRAGLTTPDQPEIDRLRDAFTAAREVGIQPIVAVYSFSRDTPLTAPARADFASYAATILRAIPKLRYISLGNEPN